MEQRLALSLVLYLGLSVYSVFYLRASLFENYAARMKLSPIEAYDILQDLGHSFALFVLWFYFDLLGSPSEMMMNERLRRMSTDHSRIGMGFFALGQGAALVMILASVVQQPSLSGYLIAGYCLLILLAVVGQSVFFHRRLMSVTLRIKK
ncbi:MAG: hypothetical protein K8I82_23840 [Anaerolineae bacterium]|nr:hypothetical protein [Anaerolineae bacterium]